MMMKNMFNSKKYVCKTLWILALAYVFLMFFSATAISAHHTRCKKKVAYHEPDQYKDHFFNNNWIAKRGQHKQKNKFDNLSPEEQADLKEKYERWRTLPQKDKEMLRHRENMWKNMSPQDKQRYLHRHKQWQEMSPEERRRLRDKLEYFEDLPQQEQNQIRQRFKNH